MISTLIENSVCERHILHRVCFDLVCHSFGDTNNREFVTKTGQNDRTTTHYCTLLQQRSGKPTQRQQDVCRTLEKMAPRGLGVTMATHESQIFDL